MKAVERADGESGIALKNTRAMYDNLSKRLDQKLVALPSDQTGCHFIFCMDASETMEGERWQKAKDAYRTFFDERVGVNQDQDDLVTLLTFNDEATCHVGGAPLSSVWHKKLDNVNPGGSKMFCPAWQRIQGFAMDHKNKTRKNVIVFMTDGPSCDIQAAEQFASALWSQLFEFGGMTLFVISLEGENWTGKLDNLVLAGNNHESVFTDPEEQTHRLGMPATQETIVNTFRSIACCMTAQEDQVKHKIEIIAEQRSRREHQFHADRQAELERKEAMLKSMNELSKKVQQGAALTEQKKKILIQENIEAVKTHESDVQSLIAAAQDEHMVIEKQLARLSSDLDHRQTKVDDEMTTLQRHADTLRKQQEHMDQKMDEAVDAKQAISKQLGNVDAQDLESAIAIYLHVRQKQILSVEGRLLALRAVSRQVTGMADQLEGPLTNEFSEGTEAHLVLRYFKKEAKLMNLSGKQTRAAADFRIIVEYIADQVKLNHRNDVVDILANEFDLVELCRTPPLKAIALAAIQKDQENRLIKKLKITDKDLRVAHNLREKAQTKVTKAAKALKRAEAAAEDEDEKGGAEDLQEFETELADASKDLEEAEAELLEVLSEHAVYADAQTLLQAVGRSFQQTVRKETMQKELDQVKEDLESMMDILQGPVQTYSDIGVEMKKAFNQKVKTATLQQLREDPVQKQLAVLDQPITPLRRLEDSLQEDLCRDFGSVPSGSGSPRGSVVSVSSLSPPKPPAHNDARQECQCSAEDVVSDQGAPDAVADRGSQDAHRCEASPPVDIHLDGPQAPKAPKAPKEPEAPEAQLTQRMILIRESTIKQFAEQQEQKRSEQQDD
jgi:hypothetical protein